MKRSMWRQTEHILSVPSGGDEEEVDSLQEDPSAVKAKESDATTKPRNDGIRVNTVTGVKGGIDSEGDEDTGTQGARKKTVVDKSHEKDGVEVDPENGVKWIRDLDFETAKKCIMGLYAADDLKSLPEQQAEAFLHKFIFPWTCMTKNELRKKLKFFISKGQLFKTKGKCR